METIFQGFNPNCVPYFWAMIPSVSNKQKSYLLSCKVILGYSGKLSKPVGWEKKIGTFLI